MHILFCLRNNQGGFGVRKALKLLSIFIVLIAVFSMSGCKLSILSAEKLLRPPKSGAEIEKAIEDFAGESIILKSPVNSSSEFTSPLTLTDLDNDGEEEAVVFYVTATNDTGVHLSVLKHIGDEWVSIGDFSGYGSNIETLSFRNLAKDTNGYDIITTWSYIDSNVLTIHKIAGSGRRAELRTVCNMSYDSMGYVDIDKDGYHEIFLINGDFSDKTNVPTAKLIRIEKYSVLNIGMTSLSRDIVGYKNAHCQDISDENIPMIAVYDYVNEKGLFGTDIIYWDSVSSSLKLMQVDLKSKSAFSTVREMPIYSADVNADTFIDVPVQEFVVGAVQNKNSNSPITYTKWCSLIPSKDGLGLEACSNYRLYFSDKEYLDVEEKMISKMTVFRSSNSDSWIIATYNPDNAEKNEVLIDVRSINHDDLELYISNGYKQLSSNTTENKFIVYNITENGQNFGFKDTNLVSIKIQ